MQMADDSLRNLVWEFINSPGTGTFVCLIKYRSRNRHGHIWGGRAMYFLLMTSGLVKILTRIVYLYIIDNKMFNWQGMSFVFRSLTDGGRDGIWWLVPPGHWLSCPGWQYFLSMNYQYMGYCIDPPPPYEVSVHGLSFWNTDWTCYNGPLLY